MVVHNIEKYLSFLLCSTTTRRATGSYEGHVGFCYHYSCLRSRRRSSSSCRAEEARAYFDRVLPALLHLFFFSYILSIFYLETAATELEDDVSLENQVALLRRPLWATNTKSDSSSLLPTSHSSILQRFPDL